MKRVCESLNPAVYLLVILGVNVACALSALGQCQNAGFKQALADPASQTISLFLFPRITEKDRAIAADPQAWTIADLTPQTATPPAPLKIDRVDLAGDRQNPNNILSAEVHYTIPLDPTHRYVLSNVGLTFNGCAPPQPPLIVVAFELKSPPAIAADKAIGRQDANIYVAGQLEGARKGRAKQTADIKIEIPLALMTSSTHSLDFVPFFDLKASNSKKSDASSLKFGGMIRNTYNFERLGLTNVSWETDGRIEADRRFGNINAVWGNTLYFIPPLLGQSEKALVYLQPFIGAELGRNLKSPVKEAEDRGIARATAGASLYLLFPLGKKNLDSISFQTDYVRRWPLHGEVSFTEDDNGKLQPLFIGRNPRDYVSSKLEFNINDFWGVSIGYDHGRLPPNFQLVDSHYSVGFVFKKKLIK
jgi:hypothetical protein